MESMWDRFESEPDWITSLGVAQPRPYFRRYGCDYGRGSHSRTYPSLYCVHMFPTAPGNLAKLPGATKRFFYQGRTRIFPVVATLADALAAAKYTGTGKLTVPIWPVYSLRKGAGNYIDREENYVFLNMNSLSTGTSYPPCYIY